MEKEKSILSMDIAKTPEPGHKGGIFHGSQVSVFKMILISIDIVPPNLVQ